MISKANGKEIDINAVVDRLVGEVKAIGDSHFDEETNENLKTLGELYLHIQSTLCECATMLSRYEGSMHSCGEIAVDYLDCDREYVKEVIEENRKCDAYPNKEAAK